VGVYTKYAVPGEGEGEAVGDEGDIRYEKAMATLKFAVEIACASNRDGGDEVLYGRAGLLWALLNLKKLHPKLGERMRGWAGGGDVVKVIVQRLIDAGRRGRVRAKIEYNVDTLMWEWHDAMYLGRYV
jgi:hypothetical protein